MKKILLGVVAILVGIGAIAPSALAGGYAPKLYRVKLTQQQVETSRVHPGQKNVLVGAFTVKAYLPAKLSSIAFTCSGDVFERMTLVADGENLSVAESPYFFTSNHQQIASFMNIDTQINMGKSQTFRVFADVALSPTAVNTKCGIAEPWDVNVYVTKKGESVYSGTLGRFGTAFSKKSIVVEKPVAEPTEQRAAHKTPDVTVLQASAGGQIAQAGQENVTLGMFVIEASAPVELRAFTYTCTVPSKSLKNMKLMFGNSIVGTVATTDAGGNATATFTPHIGVSDQEPLMVKIVGDLTHEFTDQVNVYCGIRSATAIQMTDMANGMSIRSQALDGDFGLQKDDAPIYMIPQVI